jgi:hypothetical protein
MVENGKLSKSITNIEFGAQSGTKADTQEYFGVNLKLA